MWILKGKQEEMYREMWEKAMDEMIAKMIATSTNGLTYVAELDRCGLSATVRCSCCAPFVMNNMDLMQQSICCFLGEQEVQVASLDAIVADRGLFTICYRWCSTLCCILAVPAFKHHKSSDVHSMGGGVLQRRGCITCVLCPWHAGPQFAIPQQTNFNFQP